MAGQRRKKRKLPSESMENYKPELTFIESPLQGEKHYRTPVQAARNPFLAPVVPVEDDVSWKWVSPQFQTQLNSSEDCVAFGARKKRRTRKTEGTVSQASTAKLNKNRLFAPLAFCTTDNQSEKESVNKSSAQCSLRRSCRLKSKEQRKCDDRAHFLLEGQGRHTPKNKSAVILAYETPDDHIMLPAVLRRLRTRKKKLKEESRKLVHHPLI